MAPKFAPRRLSENRSTRVLAVRLRCGAADFGGGISAYPDDLHPDGKRLEVIAAADESEGVAQDKVVFFFNFGEYLKKIALVKP